MAFGGGSKGIKNEINVTPLVDVVLVLLIIFMVITPMLQRGKPVELPKAHQQESEKEGTDPLILSVTQEKQLFVEQDPVNEDALEEKVRSELVKKPGRKVLLKGDARLTVGDVRKIMKRTNTAGAKGISLGIEELKQ